MDRQAKLEAARLLAELRCGGPPLADLPPRARPGDADEAYAVQDELHALLATRGLGPPVGHKIGCTTPVMQRFLDIPHPCAGGIFETTVHRAQEAPLRLAHGDFRRLGLECEIAVELGAPLPPEAAPFDRGSVARAVRAVLPAVEIVDRRFVDFTKAAPASLIADDFFNAAALLGAPVTDWRNLDLEGLAGSLRVDGREIGRGVGRDILGHPLEALVWLADLMAARGHGLAAGSFVLLGSVVRTHWPEPGERIEARLEGLGVLRLEIA